MVRSTSLSLGIPSSASPISSNVTSPTDPGSHPSSPGSTNASRIQAESLPQSRLNYTEIPVSSSHIHEDPPLSPEFTSLPQFPASPTATTPKGGPDSSKGFFANLKASKSSNRVNNVSEPTIRQVSEEVSRTRGDLTNNPVYSRTGPGSTTDLSVSAYDSDPTDHLRPDTKTYLTAEELRQQTKKGQEQKIVRRPVGSPTRSDDAIRMHPMDPHQMKKPKPRFSNLIGRTKSVRMDDLPQSAPQNPARSSGYRSSGLSSGQPRKTVSPISTPTNPGAHPQHDATVERHSRHNTPHNTPLHTPLTPNAPLTAPLPDRSVPNESRLSPGPAAIPGHRNRSADRAERGHVQDTLRQENRHPTSGLSSSSSGQLREAPASHLFSNIKNTSSRAAGGLNKAGKGIFAKMNRSGSSTAHTQEEQRYVCRIINLPLVEQTRKTRIAARLENSKDKTEFWMPALPWRCIDYLNFRGCEEEGLYRVPGSDREIRLWQKRFDQEGDINLFDEDNLYDINIIGSLFKSWLRELPTEIFPKATQIKIYQANPEATEVPQMLKDELSQLQPWNYYLLFAITCHLSLLTAYSDKNKMTYGNLVICFQPCLKIDNFCFQFLVQQWRECWQGCWTEKDALDEEYHILEGTNTDRGGVLGSSGDSSGGSTAVGGEEERSVASSSSNQPMSKSSTAKPSTANSNQSTGKASNQPTSASRPQQSRPSTLTIPPTTQEPKHRSKANGNGSKSSGHARGESQLPELAPVQPLSPIGF